MEMIENPMIMNIPSREREFGTCDKCGSEQNYTLYFKDGDLIGCEKCLPKVSAWGTTICPICKSEDCRVLYLNEDGGYYGCDDCVFEADYNSMIFIEYEKR